jgi:hypothetical protein
MMEDYERRYEYRKSMEERRSHKYRESRVIEVWCEEPSHEPVALGLLRSVSVVHFEVWTVDGPYVETQRLSPDKGPPDTLALLDRVAERYRVRCPRCGFDVVAGDRLGPRPGMRYLWENQPGVDKGRPPVAAKTDRVLSEIADAGISRLSLSTLGRILSL